MACSELCPVTAARGLQPASHGKVSGAKLQECPRFSGNVSLGLQSWCCSTSPPSSHFIPPSELLLK